MDKKEYICATKLLFIVNTHEVFDFFLTESERNDLARACVDIKKKLDWNFKYEEFFKILSTSSYLPLEFIWQLHILCIMPLESYFLNIYSKSEILEKFKESAINLCIQDFEESDVPYFVQTGFISYFVRKGFPATSSKNSDNRVEEVCLESVKGILQGIFLLHGNKIRGERFSGFFSLWNAGILEEVSLQAFCIFTIQYILIIDSLENDPKLYEIFESSEFNVSHFNYLSIIEKLVKPIKYERIYQVIFSIIQKSGINLNYLLIIVRATLNIHIESSTSIQKLISEVMNEACEKMNYDLLLRSLLIGRLTSFQPNTASHFCHRQWFQHIFKNCRHFKNAESFSLLIQVLSDLVPFHKNIECIKAVIDSNIPVPSKAQSVYDDYILLLKTRIHDLKPQVHAEEMVAKILSLYEILDKIPPVVTEMSFLQKHKFFNEFLPALLKPRVIPQIPDVRERFIDVLHKAGKIPSSLLQKYRDICQLKQQSLLAGVNMDEHFDVHC